MLQPMPARYRNVFPSLGPCRPGCWGCIRQLNSMPQWPQQLQPSVLPRPAGRSAACGGRLLYPPLTSPSLQGRSWPLNATTQKTLSAHPVRMVSTSRAGQRKGTARPMKSVRTVSAPCPQRVGSQGLHSTLAHSHRVPTAFDRRWPHCEETWKRNAQHCVPVPGWHALL